MKKYTILLAALLCFLSGFGQSSTGILSGKIMGNAKPYTNRITLRWNTDNYQLMQMLTQEGLWIQRQTIDTATRRKSAWTDVCIDTVRAWSLARIGREYAPSDTIIAIVAQCLYGKGKADSTISLIEKVQQYQYDQQNRHLIISLYALLNPKAALISGLGFEDSLKVNPSQDYLYRIMPANRHTGYHLDTGYIYVVGDDINRQENVWWLYAQGRDGAISLQWSTRDNHFTAYHVARSTDGKNFTRITKRPYLPGIDTNDNTYVYTDSVPNYRTYYYRLIGLNSFGEEVESKDIVSASAKDLTPPQAPFLEGKLEDDKAVLKWTASAEKDLKGYYVVWGADRNRADSMATPQLLLPGKNNFTYTFPPHNKASYFRIIALDTANNYSISNFSYIAQHDLTPPKAPEGLEGTIDSMGKITLRWQWDTTDQIKGYKVFIANQEDHRFAAVSNIIAQDSFSFSTTLNTLSPNLLVKIVAVDQNFNHSEYSRMLVLTRRDTIPPPEPVFNNYFINGKTVELAWGEIQVYDFAHYVILRRLQDEKIWADLGKTTKSSFKDTTAKEKTAYEYSLLAVDKNGLKSTPATPVVLTTGRVPKQETIRIRVERTADGASVSWSPSLYVINAAWLYADFGEGLTLCKVLPDKQYQFVDKGKKAKTYAIKMIYEDGSESAVFQE